MGKETRIGLKYEGLRGPYDIYGIRGRGGGGKICGRE